MRSMKRILCLILVLAMMAALPILTAAAAGKMAVGVATVNASALNMRSGAGTDNSVITSIGRGATVVVLEKTSDTWYKVSYNGTSGYVCAEYLSGFSATGELKASGKVNDSDVNIRSSASTSGSILGSASSGTAVSVTGLDNGWYRLNYNGKTGYIRSDYVDLTSGSGSSSSGSSSASSSSSSSSSSSQSSEKSGKVNADYVNFRSAPSTGSSVIRMLNSGTAVTVLEETSGWYKISCNGTVGYMSSKYVTVSGSSSSSSSSQSGSSSETNVEAMNEKGKVTGNYVNFRSGPSTNYKVIATLKKGTKVDIVGKTSGWYKISYGGSTGYMSSTYVAVDDGTVQEDPEPVLASVAPTNSKGAEIAEYTKQFAGYRYVYGGASPSGGFDCSGLVYYVYGKFGYSLPHGATSQYNKLSKYVEKKDLQPGDLVFFSNNGFASITHVGIYLGNNKFIHAAGTNTGVIISDLSSAYYTSVYYGAKRVV